MKKGFLQSEKKTNKQRREEMKEREQERLHGKSEASSSTEDVKAKNTRHEGPDGRRICADSWAPTTKSRTLDSIARGGVFEAAAPVPGLTEKVTVTKRTFTSRIKIKRRKFEERKIEIYLVIPPTKWTSLQLELVERVLPHTLITMFATRNVRDMVSYSTVNRVTSYLTTA